MIIYSWLDNGTEVITETEKYCLEPKQPTDLTIEFLAHNCLPGLSLSFRKSYDDLIILFLQCSFFDRPIQFPERQTALLCLSPV
mmetsp:Transcript_28851/g.65162  ORF Transcript_28851/g.65162 Transcript_28851/m.65162 type:complete len:84 (-) Transcript_28851:640-891(-)